MTLDERPVVQPRRRRLTGMLTWVLALAIALGWFFFLRPAGLGGPAGYVIVSGESMEPMMQTGDLAIVHRESHYDIGDVVAYRIPADDVGGGMLVIHRIIGGTAGDGFILQGDNRDTPDMWRPTSDDVVGSLRVYVPHAGTALFLLRTPIVIAAVIGFLGFWFVATSPDKKTRTSEANVGDVQAELDQEPVLERVAGDLVIRRPEPAGRGFSPATLAAGAVVLLSLVGAAREAR